MRTEEFDYKLVGVVIHMGVADAGHYLSYINIDRNDSLQGKSDSERAEWAQTENQTWLEFNDSNVSHFDFTNLQKKAFGEVQEKQGGGQMVLDQGDEVAQASVGVDGA